MIYLAELLASAWQQHRRLRRKMMCVVALTFWCAMPLRAQLGALNVTESACPIMIDPSYPEKAILYITSSLQTLEFEATLGIVADKSEPEHGIYRLLLEPRRQGVAVRASGYRGQRIDLPAMEPRDVQCYSIEPHDPGRGTLVIETVPSDARITSVNGVPAEPPLPTPHTFEYVLAQALRLSVEREKYALLDTVVVVEPEVAITRTLRLRPTFGFLTVTTTPGSQLLLDGTPVSFENGQQVEVPVGTHTLSLRKAFHEPFDTTLTMAPGAFVAIAQSLPRQRATLRVASSPAGATVLLDGTDVGVTPLETLVDVGVGHQLTLRREGHVPVVDELPAIEAATDRAYVLLPFETRTENEAVRFANVQLERAVNGLVIQYDLVGEAGKKYEVALTLMDATGRKLRANLGEVSGDVGKNQKAGNDQQIAWQPSASIPEDAHVVLSASPQRGRGLLFAVGGAVLAAGGASAVLLLGGGDGGTGTPPPGGTANLPTPPARPSGQ